MAKPTAQPSARDPDIDAADHEFRDGRTRLSAPPTRFYLNLTERCTLRCRHCITRAPELTATGVARDMLPEVLDRLRPHLRHAAYVGFVHAGEPLAAPALEPVLTAVRDARRGRPTVVHVLTNGVGLTVDRFAQLVGLGVNSWSVSIDGMSAATNDALRVGSSAAELLENVRWLSEARRPGAGIRLGLAWTVTPSNLGEIEALVRFAADVGIDWVKLEEMFPVNAVAAQQADIELTRLLEVTKQAEALADSLGIKLVEHVFPKPVLKCRLAGDPVVERFSRLDDFANRMEINYCRLPFELVCVEPNGDVKPISFRHRVAGNLLKADFLSIWNSGPFMDERRQVLAERPCRRGAVTCGVDPGPTGW